MTSDLTAVSGISDDTFGTWSFLSKTVSNNYIELRGCTGAGLDEYQNDILLLSDLMNPKQVKTTDSFSIEFYAYDSSSTYRIARLTSGMYID